MPNFYERVKDRFDNTETLCPKSSAVFSELFLNEPLSDEAIPFCCTVLAEETKVEGTFASNYHTDPFSFWIADATYELVKSHADLVEAAFLDCEADLGVTGLTVLRLDKIGRRFEQVDRDRWHAIIDYEALYQVSR